ncbi:bifunctional Rhomboid-like superfamily/Peptidase S54 [Babesia duncani]|uniref:Bifunctional Rhomboid-like superfamily/Peptidase S54 n=1 Tax=Babesia duncani TaxID=323732 RepID=A0AAD9UNK5_9APIC|nr:bifunctional Rhomboid-like superfamily/Peptidase S54 [Babesia duncani]
MWTPCFWFLIYSNLHASVQCICVTNTIKHNGNAFISHFPYMDSALFGSTRPKFYAVKEYANTDMPPLGYTPDKGPVTSEGTNDSPVSLKNVWKHCVGSMKQKFATISCNVFDGILKQGQEYITNTWTEFYNNINLMYYKLKNMETRTLFYLGNQPVYDLIKLNALVYFIDTCFANKYLINNHGVRGLDIFFKREHFRLITSLFIHNDLMHLISNMSSLFSVGCDALAKFGTRRFLLIYFISGTVANYFSYLYNFVYAHGIPADAEDIAKYLSLNDSFPRKVVCSTSREIFKDVMERNRNLPFYVYMAHYLTGVFYNAYDSLLSRVIDSVVPPKQDKRQMEMETVVRNICMLNTTSQSRSAGASGAIYGLQGAIVSYYLQGGTNQDYWIALDIVQRLILQNIWSVFGSRTDHVSHLAGLATGALMAYLM